MESIPLATPEKTPQSPYDTLKSIQKYGMDRGKIYPLIEKLLALPEEELDILDRPLNAKGLSFGNLRDINDEKVIEAADLLAYVHYSKKEREGLRQQILASVIS